MFVEGGLSVCAVFLLQAFALRNFRWDIGVIKVRAINWQCFENVKYFTVYEY